MTDYELIKHKMKTDPVKCYRYRIEFLGREHGEQVLAGPSYRVGGYYKYRDSEPRLLTIEVFDPSLENVRRYYDVRGPIKILQKRELA